MIRYLTIIISINILWMASIQPYINFHYSSDTELFTEKIMLYNKTRSVVSKEEVLFINNKDSLKGIGFWSDFDMENWKIEKPIGAIIKD